MSKWVNCLLAGIVVAASLAASSASAVTLSYSFSGTVDTINSAAPGFDPSLAAVAVDTPVTATATFQSDVPPTPSVNNFPGDFGNATLYRFSSYSLTANVDGVGAFDATGPGDLLVFVWDNDSPSGGDGILFMNLALGSDFQLQIANISLPTTTFSSEDLPLGDITEAMALSFGLGSNANFWLTASNGQGLTFERNLVSEPALLSTLLLLLAAGHFTRRLRHQRSPSV